MGRMWCSCWKNKSTAGVYQKPHVHENCTSPQNNHIIIWSVLPLKQTLSCCCKQAIVNFPGGNMNNIWIQLCQKLPYNFCNKEQTIQSCWYLVLLSLPYTFVSNTDCGGTSQSLCLPYSLRGGCHVCNVDNDQLATLCCTSICSTRSIMDM